MPTHWIGYSISKNTKNVGLMYKNSHVSENIGDKAP
jgi:hypothetical protein